VVSQKAVIGEDVDRIAAGEMVKLGTAVELEVALPSLLMIAEEKRVNLRIPVPAGRQQQVIKIKKFDDRGPRVIYEEVHAPGDLVEQQVIVRGRATVMVFIDDVEHAFRTEYL
jgi:serine/threonine-protein kinase